MSVHAQTIPEIDRKPIMLPSKYFVSRLIPCVCFYKFEIGFRKQSSSLELKEYLLLGKLNIERPSGT
jgi:hypothetical protein